MKLWKKLFDKCARFYYNWYLQKDRKFQYGFIKLEVTKGVFHPGLFHSTQFLLEYLQRFNLKGKTFLEPGCGTGLVSLYAYDKGANVIASDINPVAVKNAKKNFDNFSKTQQRDGSYKIILSDLFDELPKENYDYIVINPPYYFKNPLNESEKAWFCGEEGQYFKKLFYQLPEYINNDSKVLMVLSDNCDIARIQSIANQFGFNLKEVQKKKLIMENNFIYQIIPND